MRRVDAEGDSRGVRGRKQDGAQTKSKVRRAAIEWLERRELLSTSTSNLPSPVVVTPPSLGTAVSAGDTQTATANATSPSVSIDPVNPKKIVAVWSYHDTTNPLNVGATNTINSYVAGAFSTDGGVTWTPLGGAASANNQTDFAVSQANGRVVFTQTTDAHVVFGRDESVDILTSTHDDGYLAGVLDLQRFSFTGNTPAQTMTNKVITSWDGPDSGNTVSALTPVIAVDNNVASFVDTNSAGQKVTQTDAFTGNIYIAWKESLTRSIRMIASSDNGATFSYAAYVDHASNIATDATPQIAISQGNPTTGVPGGQVTVVYDDSTTIPESSGQPYDQILDQTDVNGATAQTFAGPTSTPINIAMKNPVSGAPDIMATTSITIPVNITAAGFKKLQALDVNLVIAYPNMAELSAVLMPPTGSGLANITLFNNGVDGSGNATNNGLAGANMGITTAGATKGAIFDAVAPVAIRATAVLPGAAAPYVGTFQPQGEAALAALKGATTTQINGNWTLVITSFKNETSFSSGPTVLSETLDFTSGNNPGATGGPFVVADNNSMMEALSPNINPGAPVTAASYLANNNTTGVQGSGNVHSPVEILQSILPAPSIASDNTLGAYSPFEGRIYVTYVGGYGAPANGQTDVFLVASDDGGQSWFAINPGESGGSSTGVQVNDDNAATDGYSAAVQGAASGRTKLEPQVQVDQYTGDVVVSFLDARNDAANARTATYVAVSDNGGVSFAPETYANPTNTSVDAITGQTVNLGPIPDNESSGVGNGNADLFGYGQYQGLVVADGTIIPFWVSNQNTGAHSVIVDSIMTDAGGPRIISSTMGPVGQPGDTVNTTRATDGTPVANSFLVTFDRPVDPATFNGDGPTDPIGTGDVRVFYQDPYGATTIGVSTPKPTVANGTYTSTATVGGQAGVPIVDGQITLSLTGFTNLGAVTVQLFAPNGRSFTIPTVAGTKSLSGTYALPAGFVGGAIAGQYQLKITDTAGQVGTLSSWSLQLNGLSVGLRVTSVTPVPNLTDPMDDGTFGYTTFRVNFTPINPNNLVPTGVGTYSYIVRPTVSDRIRTVGLGGVSTSAPVFENAQLPQLPNPGLPLTGTATTTSPLYLIGHPGQTIASGTLILSLTDTNVHDLTIKLIGPGGAAETFTLTPSTGTVLNQTYSLPASFIGQAVDGQYQLQIVGLAGDVGNLNSWSLNLNPTGPNGNAMDQNADASTGEDPETTPFTGLTPGDDYVVPTPAPTSAVTFSGPNLFGGPYTNSSLPLIVSGPHIIATNVTGTAGTTSGNTTNNLITNDQVGSVGVVYDQNVQISSVNSSQVLNVTGPAGTIGGAQTFVSSGVSKTFSATGNQIGLAIPRNGTALVSNLVIAGTGLSVSSLSVTLGITDPQDSSLTLTLVAPNGTMVPLAANVGGAGANFSNTTFSDLTPANGLRIPIASGAAPFGLTYVPASPLAALTGMALDGTWKLMIQDNTALPTALAQGVLNSWSLAVTPQIPQGAGGAPIIAPLTMLTSSLNISNPDLSFTIAHLAVKLNITAPTDKNITATLIAPDGTKVLLVNGVGGATGSNFGTSGTYTTFDDSSTVNIANGVAPFTQTYVPVSTNLPGYSSLTSLIGKTLNGTWKLVISDSTPGGSAASSVLNAWSLVATPQLKVVPSLTYTSTDTSPTTYVSTDTSQQVYSSVDFSYSNPATIQATAGSTISSSIVFPSTGGTYTIANLQVALAISYPHDTNLSVELISPTGITVPLFAGVGGQGANFGVAANEDYTIFSDAGTSGIASGTAPFESGSVLNYPNGVIGTIYRPASPLSVLDGTPIDGTWTLQVVNNSGISAGKFNGWAMIVTPQPAPATVNLPVGATQPVEPIPIVPPAGTSGPLGSFITFPSTAANYTIASLSTTLTLSAPAGGSLADLTGILIAPDGVTATLFSAGDGTFTGTGTVTKTLTPLNSISGQSQFANVALYQVASATTIASGLWELEIVDNNTGDAIDALNGWSMTTTPQKLALSQAPEPVPNTPASSLSSSITIPDSNPLSDLKIRLNLTAPSDMNLTAYLQGPNGKKIMLFTNVGGAGANFADVVFDDNATTPITSGTAPFSGTYKPQEPISDFLAGGLASTQGQWTLVITDTVPNSGGPTAVLNSWSLINTPPAGATLANSFQIEFPTQQLSGTYSLTVGAGILGADPSVNNPFAAANPALGTAANPNLNAGVDILKGTSASGVIPTVTTVYNAASVPVAIPAAPNSSVVGTLVSQIVVPDSFVIQGVTSTGLPGLTVQLNITYANDPDLAAVLIAPDGTQIPLFTHVGTGSNTANFTNTVFNDTINPPAPIDNAGAPFFGSFNPETPLSNLKGHEANGTWSLEITNRGTGRTGTLTSWSLTFQKPVPSSGLGDPVADQQSVTFQIFNLQPSNPLANDTWTAVGPAGVTTTTGESGTFAGSVATVAVDPSDPTGNTVYVGSSSGGIWKTTNFLTSNPAGPTYLPLTDFGPSFSLDVGSIAVFGKNSDPSQSVLFAGTGFSDATAGYNGQGANYPNYGGNSGRGVGILRSTDGGATWTLLDSSTNVDSSGTQLPENSSSRDHIFVGDTTYKIVVDPTPEANGNIIVYAALGGPTGGLYQSLDSGNTWKLLSSTYFNPSAGVNTSFNNAAATDIILDPNSKSPTTGNIDIIYAAFQGLGVFISSNEGQSFSLMTGQLGKDPLITGPGFPAQPVAVQNAGVTPNSGSDGTIVLAKPALTGNAAEDLLYQDWLYAAVENQNGTFSGLYVTKDRGENWTLVQLDNLPGTASVKAAVPTNNPQAGNSYDPTENQFTQNGNYNLTLTIDPTNPNIVYIGGSQNFQESGLIRVDLTDLYDPHNLTSFANNRPDGGATTLNTTGAISVANPTTVNTNGVVYPATIQGPSPYLNFRHAPNTGVPGTSPFNVNATLVVRGAAAAGFTNDGSGATWTVFDEPLKANAGDGTGSTNLHDAIAYIDPVTGNVRMIFADDQGVFTAVVNPDGTLDDGIGTDVSANYSRNGNLQDEQFYYGAAQPSSAAAQAAGALFYASGQTLLAAQSDPNLLNNGDITWDDSGVLTPNEGSRATAANSSIVSSDRSGVGIATDPTGGTTISNPTGTGPSVYEFDVPSLGGNLTDFFRVNGVGQTTGLAGTVNQSFPFGNARASGDSGNNLANAVANGQIPLGNFAVNPLNGSQILIGSATGVLYETTTKGVQWLPIGEPTNFDSTQLSAIVYGAPDPSAPSGVGNLNNFIYVGTVGGNGSTSNTGGGQIYVTQTGGQGWTDISSGLDGGSVIAIYTNPNRGSHEAYAVTLNGVFYSPDTVGLAAAGKTVWTNITNNLTQIQSNPFNNPLLGQSVFAGFTGNGGNGSNSNAGTAQYGGFSSIVADYRYAIPDSNGVVHPVLYVSGYGGVFRSLDNGQTWTLFPNTSFDSAPVNGGYLPTVDVTNLQLVLGDINPATGHATQTTGDPEILLASTGGRGEFAIGLAPDVFPNTIALDLILPAPGGSDSGLVRGFPTYTNVKNPVIDGTSEVSNFGNVVTISLIDEATGIVIGTGTTDAFGHFINATTGAIGIPISAQGTNPNAPFYDPSFLLDGVKNVGIQATDSAGAKGNITTFTYNLKATPPAAVTSLTLSNDSTRVVGVFNGDGITNLIPSFTASTVEPVTTEVELIRNNLQTGQSEIVDTEIPSTSQGVLTGKVSLNDTLLASELALEPNGTIAQNINYSVVQIDLADNTSAATSQTIYFDNVPPPATNAPTLDPSTNSGTDKTQNITNNLHPLFNVTGLLTTGTVSPYNLELFRSIGGSTPVMVGTAVPGATKISDTMGIPSVNGAPVNGVYLYQVVQVDLAGNVSPLSPGTAVTINTQFPAVPTLVLYAPDDSGAPSHPNVTNVTDPRFNGTGTAGLTIALFNQATGQQLATGIVAANGTYLLQVGSPTGPVASGTYTIVARITNAAGNSTSSAPLTITIKATGPQVVPTLSILPADDTGIVGDGVTANHSPRFTGKADPGDQVSLYALINGQLMGPEATATASTVNGSFTFQLPFSLTNGTTQLQAQATDIAGNKGPLSVPFNVRIVTVAGDYYDTGAAQLTIFNPSNETYVVYGAGSATVDTTPGRDVPVQYDYNGDGRTDLVGYRFNTAEYFGTLSNTSPLDQQYGQGGVALPVSGTYGGTGTFIYGAYYPGTATWAVALPQPGGFVTKWGDPNVDIPVPAAYDGGGVDQIAVFRPTTVGGNDADSFIVDDLNGYTVSFTNPAVTKLGFVYKAGDIPAPADYDGVGRDEFAIYRPSTGQFFILNTPNVFQPSTWTLRTVTINFGTSGPNVNDEPVSEDYSGNGKVDPAVYRPSNSTFYIIQSTNGQQENIQFGTPNGVIAAAGPLLYRLTALTGAYTSTGGYPGGTGTVGTKGFSALSFKGSTDVSAASTSTSSSSPVTTTMAVASPMLITQAAPAPAPAASVIVSTTPASAAAAITIGASTPKAAVATAAKSKSHHPVAAPHAAAAKKKEEAKPVVKVEPKAKTPAVAVKSSTRHPKASTTPAVKHLEAAVALQKLALAKKAKKD